MAPPINDDPQNEYSADENKSKRLEQLLPDVFKRAFYAGLGAVFSTEEGIRKLASDFHLPKDVAAYLMQQANNTKDDFFRIVAREVRTFLETVNLSNELQKLLTSLSFEIKTEIRFTPNEESAVGVKPQVRKQVTIKRAGKSSDTAAEASHAAGQETIEESEDESDGDAL